MLLMTPFRRHARLLFGLLPGLMLVLGLSACMDEGRAIRARGLVYCSEGAPESLNPQIATTGTSHDAGANTLFDRLFDLDPHSGALLPALATRYEILDQGLRVRVHLRSDVAFHHNERFTPSRPLNADDVVFSFERQRDRAHPYHHVGRGQYSYFVNLGLDRLLRRVQAVDALTVDFHLQRPAVFFPTLLSLPFASIHSAEYAGQLQRSGNMAQLDSLPIGTGPFRLKRHDAGAVIRFEAHEQYFRGRPPLDRLVFAITPDPSLRLSRVRAAECDVMSQPAPHHLPLVRKDESLDVHDQPGLNVSFWAFNTTRPPLDDVRVRRALAHAINRQAIINSVYGGAAAPADSPLPPGVAGHDAALGGYAYDPARARQLLAAAGHEKGFSLDIWAVPVSRPYNPNARKTAELVQEDLRRIGVRSRIVSYEWSDFLQRLRRGEHDSVLMGWTGDMPDADNFLRPLLSCAGVRSGSNRSLWCQPDFDELLSVARNSTQAAQREAAWQNAQQIFKREAPWATLAYSTQVLVARKGIQGLRLSPSGGVFFDRAEKH